MKKGDVLYISLKEGEEQKSIYYGDNIYIKVNGRVIKEYGRWFIVAQKEGTFKNYIWINIKESEYIGLTPLTYQETTFSLRMAIIFKIDLVDKEQAKLEEEYNQARVESTKDVKTEVTA